MEKIEHRIIDWLVIALFGVIDFLLIPLSFNKLFPEYFNIKVDLALGEMDLLAFLGAIFGGLATYLGVKMTLNSTQKQKFLESFPGRVMNLDKLINEVTGLDIKIFLEKEEDYNLGDYWDFISNKMVEPAASVDANVYEKVITFETNVFHESLAEHLFAEDDDFEQRKKDLRKCVQELANDLRDYRKNLLEQFKELQR